jgi:N6-L-threonylcarbamoyladenine synthase
VLILGIETSCDETAAAVVADGRVVHSNIVASQVALHAPFGGVFPELASRQHIRDITGVVSDALVSAGAAWTDLDALAVTVGPGLSGSLLVGVNAAKGMALATGLPLLGVNHLEGHLYSNWLHDGRRVRGPLDPPADPADDPPFPHLALVISGGHTDLLLVSGHGVVELLGATLDDAAGEAFDKAARMLGLGYPGGPALERAAAAGDPQAFRLPVATTASPFDFSFSGLKTAVLRLVQAADQSGLPPRTADIAASFQEAVARALVQRARAALRSTAARALLVAGGVSANEVLRRQLREAVEVPVWCPPPVLCTDNAAMIAAAAFWRHLARPGDGGQVAEDSGLGLDVDAASSFSERGGATGGAGSG